MPDANGLRPFGALKHPGLDQVPLLAKLIGVGEAVPHHRIRLARRQRVEQRVVVVDQEHELHVGTSLFGPMS